ncbi:LuxR C-terminal-related transcriptional regulator [Streptomyces sp. ACA25]|uniref:helix-turn-helix transcriptional regulator n=1 Tax=Streptomyces sp. ACA25 TaxID=3022596 RepID=UPI00230708CA|nr:LuxR C-terminal-related transcriptional regulator [Streptomyces sp. ACA25]MDB1090197.1 LuxR C-terminal-related transcriptional regulator [Streptomyces sp. ACA25]
MAGVSQAGRSAADRHDAVEQSLLQARELIEHTVSLHRSGPEQRSLAPLPSEQEPALDLVRKVIDSAQYSLTFSTPVSVDDCPCAAIVLPEMCRASRRGVMVRVLCSHRVLGTEAVWSLLGAGSACDLRVSGGQVQQALIADCRVAIMRSEDEYAPGGGVITEDPATVRTLDLLLAGAWNAALSPVGYQRLSEQLRKPRAQRVLQRLRAGQTDEAAAGELQVSLRTYRRHVAEIMRALGADSRFQAGVRAVELGLLDPE